MKIHVAAVLAISALYPIAAQALPAAPIAAAGSGVGLVQIRGGCGYGEHRGPFGGCRLNRGPRGRIRRLITGAPRGCPPGYTRLRGVCRFVD